MEARRRSHVGAATRHSFATSLKCRNDTLVGGTPRAEKACLLQPWLHGQVTIGRCDRRHPPRAALMHANLSTDISKLVQSLSIVVIEDNSFTQKLERMLLGHIGVK